MSRVRRGFKARRRRNKILKLAKGYSHDRKSNYYQCAETVKKALQNVFIGRRLLKRDMRKLWIVRINAATKSLGTSYSRFINDLKKKDIVLNRKMLSEIAARDFEGFKAILSASK
jgi:large subunit ribosomal protein L20